MFSVRHLEKLRLRQDKKYVKNNVWLMNLMNVCMGVCMCVCVCVCVCVCESIVIKY